MGLVFGMVVGVDVFTGVDFVLDLQRGFGVDSTTAGEMTDVFDVRGDLRSASWGSGALSCFEGVPLPFRDIFVGVSSRSANFPFFGDESFPPVVSLALMQEILLGLSLVVLVLSSSCAAVVITLDLEI